MRAEIRAAVHAVINDTIGTMRKPVQSRRFQRAVAMAPGPIKVNVGAGGAELQDWINTDIAWWVPMYLDLTRRWPVPSESINFIYADNVIEHFPLEVCRTVLRNCWNAMAKGGRIRLATPDVERTARAYLEDAQLTAAHLDRHRRHGFPVEYPVDMLRVTYSYHGHHEGYCFDWEALSSELSVAGFVDIRRFSAGESSEPAFRGLETRDEASEVATELIVEARKSGGVPVN